jgi:hypothetical protein
MVFSTCWRWGPQYRLAATVEPYKPLAGIEILADQAMLVHP